MTITICGSIAFIDEMYALKAGLEKKGFEVLIPPSQVPGENGELIDAKEYYKHKKSSPKERNWIWSHHSDRIHAHFDKVAKGDAILVANYDKNGITNYIGPNTLMEMGLAFHLRKPIYLLNPIPEISYTEEIRGMTPIVIKGNFDAIQIP